MEPVESDCVPAKENTHIYIRGDELNTEGIATGGIYWKGDWPAFAGVTRIIGRYDANNTKTANLSIFGML